MNCEKAKELAITTMMDHGLIDKGWVFGWFNGFSCAGYCLETDKTISLSKTIVSLESVAFVLDTIQHEIAHALVGCKQGHNEIWKKQARDLGCSDQRTFTYSPIVEAARLRKVKFVICFEGKICYTYLRKPNRKTIANINSLWVGGCKKQTQGHLKVETYNPDVHVEYFKNEY
jgi:hypothetical protein